jgi:transcriptional regulator with XRE-family HTH domain
MDPAAWRKREKLTLRDLGAKLGINANSVTNYETGRREAPTSVSLAYQKLSGGDVTPEDLHRARRRFLATEERDAA